MLNTLPVIAYIAMETASQEYLEVISVTIEIILDLMEVEIRSSMFQLSTLWLCNNDSEISTKITKGL